MKKVFYSQAFEFWIVRQYNKERNDEQNKQKRAKRTHKVHQPLANGATKIASPRKVKFVKNKALELGFSECGISKAVYLDDHAQKLEKWLTQGMHGSMSIS